MATITVNVFNGVLEIEHHSSDGIYVEGPYDAVKFIAACEAARLESAHDKKGASRDLKPAVIR